MLGPDFTRTVLKAILTCIPHYKSSSVSINYDISIGMHVIENVRNNVCCSDKLSSYEKKSRLNIIVYNYSVYQINNVYIHQFYVHVHVLPKVGTY